VRLFFVESVVSSPNFVTSCPFEIIKSGVEICWAGIMTNAKINITAAAPITPPTMNPDFVKCIPPQVFDYKLYYTLIDF
jgi:hypothetical protein